MSESKSKHNVGSYSWGEIRAVDYREESGYHYEVLRKGEKLSYWAEEEYVNQLNK
jgi:hypothetical protein